MSIGIRHFIFEDDGTLLRLSQRVVNGLIFGTDRLPQYAGRKVRMVTVAMPLESGKPQFIGHLEGTIWHFDEAGAWVPAYGPEFGAGRSVDRVALISSSDDVVDVTAQVARRRYERDHRWTPTDADVTRIVHAIWPEQAGRPVPRPEPAIGIEKRRPSMSFAAKRALDDCWKPTHNIGSTIMHLDDRDLKAFIAGAADELDPADLISSALWEGILAAAQKEMEIRKARKSGKGKWFAALEKTVSGPEAAECSTVEFVECKGRDAAVKAAREMLVKHSVLFSETTEIEARLYPAIEWSGPWQ